MGTRYLIDTCAVIKYLQNSFPEKGLIFLDSILDKECQISFITQIELLAWRNQNESSLAIYKQFIKGSKYSISTKLLSMRLLKLERILM
jgi:hypothetical protein